MLFAALLAAWLQAGTAAPTSQPENVDPALRAAIERFFATQEAEDIDGYLALWSRTAQRPQPAQLKFIFDTGDDRFFDLQILRAFVTDAQARVRVTIQRSRTDARAKRPDGSPVVFHSRQLTSLTFVREGEEWKLVSEGSPADELGLALMKVATPAERKALLDADPDLIGDRMFDAMGRQADPLARAMQFVPAQQAYERIRDVARDVGNRAAEGRALQNIANALYYQRRFDQALETYDARLAIARELSDDEGIAVALSGIATVRYSLFDYAAALPAYRDALALQEKLDDRMSVATTLISIGNVLYLHGEFDDAIASYRRSRELYRGMNYKAGESRAIEGLGLVYTAQGNLSAALDAYSVVLADSRIRNDARSTGNALFSTGQIHLRLGNADSARTSFEEARGIFEKAKDVPNAGAAWQGLGLTELVASRFAAAEKAYLQSETACAAAGELECAARSIVGLGFAQASQEQFDKAITTYLRGIAAFLKLEKSEEAARGEIGLSQAYLGNKDYESAVRAAVRARDRGIAAKKDDVVWRALLAEARAARRLGDIARATALTTDAIAAIERLSDASIDRPGRAVAADTEAAFAFMAILQASEQKSYDAFMTAERRRAHALRTALYTNEREIYRGMTDGEREEERKIVGELVALHARRDNEQGLPKPNADKLKKLDAAIADAASRRREQMRRLFDRLPELKRWRGFVTAPATVVPPPDTVVVQFVVDEDELLVVSGVALDADAGPAWQSYILPVSRQKLAERVARAMDINAVKDRALWIKSSAEVFGLLPTELVTQMGTASRLLIIPDDVLWRIPFEAIPFQTGYVVDSVPVTYTGSLLSTIDVAEKPAATSRLLAVAAPEIAPAVMEQLKATLPGWNLRSSDVAHAEAQQIAALFAGSDAAVVQTGVSATERALRESLTAASLLHVAAPFRINGASPLFSFVLLAPSGEGTDDGALEARELMNLTLDARVVAFSDGAAASMRNGAAASPILQWAWLAAGVPSLVLPRWAADDATNTSLLADLYARLKSGESPAQAMKAAIAAVRRNEATAAPFYWANWMVVGRH